MAELIATAQSESEARLPDSTTAARWSKGSLLVYGATVFLSAFLLFQVQLVIGKYILPLFGGAPAVWNTCMFCFQILLLLGYGYAHQLSSLTGVRTQQRVHSFLLVGSAVLMVVLWAIWGSPLTPGRAWRPEPGDNPVWNILEQLGATVAIPFFVLSTTGPLLQKWFSRRHTSAYRLYALSNAGSLLGLLSYPFFVEWAFKVKHQAWLWSSGYILFAALCTAIASLDFGHTDSGPKTQDDRTEAAAKTTRPSLARYALWLGLSACSTTVLLATTNLLCLDLAAIPLLWVLPLSVYLISFIVTFDRTRWYARRVFWPLYFVGLGLGMAPEFLGFNHLPLLYAVGVCGLSLFAVCMVCHGELARSKPAPEHLTSFYLTVASGGALGGTFVVLIAPRIFLGFFEYQTGLVACGFLLFAAFLLEDRSGRGEGPLWNLAIAISLGFFVSYLVGVLESGKKVSVWGRPYFTVPLSVGIFLIAQLARRGKKQNQTYREETGFPWQPVAGLLALGLFAIFAYGSSTVKAAHTLFRERNFFGVKILAKTSIQPHGPEGPDEELAVFISGTTIHGEEFTAPGLRDIPTMYYNPASGVGLLLDNHPRAGGNGSLRVGIVGLGAGTLAAYGRPGDVLRFYEIDPAVVLPSIGRDPYFHFLEDSRAHVDIVLGDGRLSLEKEAHEGSPQQFDVLVVDAFTSDSVPVHLLTVEAMKIYQHHLRNRDSVLAFNISNWYLDLCPVLAGLAQQGGLSGVRVRSPESEWILLSANPAMLRLPNLVDRAVPLSPVEHSVLWTDDYTSLFQILRARKGALW